MRESILFFIFVHLLSQSSVLGDSNVPPIQSVTVTVNGKSILARDGDIFIEKNDTYANAIGYSGLFGSQWHYTHAAIVHIKNGKAMLIEAGPAGTMEMRTLEDALHAKESTDQVILRSKSANYYRLEKTVQHAVDQIGKCYDLNSSTPEKISCAEMVVNSYKESNGMNVNLSPKNVTLVKPTAETVITPIVEYLMKHQSTTGDVFAEKFPEIKKNLEALQSEMDKWKATLNDPQRLALDNLQRARPQVEGTPVNQNEIQEKMNGVKTALGESKFQEFQKLQNKMKEYYSKLEVMDAMKEMQKLAMASQPSQSPPSNCPPTIPPEIEWGTSIPTPDSIVNFKHTKSEIEASNPSFEVVHFKDTVESTLTYLTSLCTQGVCTTLNSIRSVAEFSETSKDSFLNLFSGWTSYTQKAGVLAP